MKRFLLFLFPILFLSCETDSYDGETRYVIDLDIVDRSGISVPGQRVFVRTRGYWHESDFDTIDQKISDANGHVKMIIPKRSYAEEFQIGVAGDNTYRKRIRRGLKPSDFPGYVYDSSEFEIYRIEETTNLKIVPQQVSGAILVDFSITGATADIYFGDWDYPENAPPEDNYQVFKDSLLTLHYVLEENGVQTDYSTIINIGQQSVTYNLDY